MAIHHLLQKKHYIEDETVVEARRDLCNECPQARAGRCRECGCIIRLKTKLKTEACPIGKWGETA
jgi:hypothetical protein